MTMKKIEKGFKFSLRSLRLCGKKLFFWEFIFICVYPCPSVDN